MSHSMSFISAYEGVLYRCGGCHRRVYVVLTQEPDQHCQSTFWVESSSNHLQATSPQLAIGKLLYRLNIEDSSLEHVPASILIASVPEIWKKAFWVFPLCSLSLSLCVPSGPNLPLFPHLSPNQPTELLMGLSIFQPVSNNRNWAISLQILCELPSQFDLYQRQSIHTRPFGYHWVQVPKPQ